MKKIFFYILLLLLAMSNFGCVPQKSIVAYSDYNSKIINNEMDGSYTLRSWGRDRHYIRAYHQAQKQAVYDIIFNRVEAASSNQESLKPLVLDANVREKHKEYFDEFFAENGEYKQFCSMKDKRWFSSEFYRSDAQILCKTTVRVYRSALHKKLKEDGIIN